MVNLMEVIEMTEQKLDRKLEQQEIDFMRWLYKKQATEEIVELE